MTVFGWLRRLLQPSPVRETERQRQREQSHCKRHDYRGKLNALAQLTDLANREFDAAMVRLNLIRATGKESHEVGCSDADRPERVADGKDAG